MMGRLARETDEGKKIAVVLDNARFHHAKALNDLYAPGQALERITELRLVANAFLPYPDLLDQYFGKHEILAKTGKFKVYSVRN